MRLNYRAIVVVLLSTVTVGACGDDFNDSSNADGAISNEITGHVHEWAVDVDAMTAKAGVVNFTITNDGTIGHEFLVVKTEIADGKIPLAGDHFEEPSDGIEVIDEIGEFPVGETNKLTVTLEPGTYQLVCNLPAHYGSGMHMVFKVIS